MNIYIGGGSYCYERNSNSWLHFFSNKLNAKTEGKGYPGRGFWNSRLHLIDYLKTGTNTDLFVFCHTEPSRIISSTYSKIKHTFDADSKIPPNNKEIVEMYYKYLYEEDIHNWAMKSWFLELNQILSGKPVIHLFSSAPTFRLSEQLMGYKLKTDLFTHTLNSNTEAGPRLLENAKIINHFTIDYNIKFGNALADYCIDEVLVNPTQTKYFDFAFYNK